MTVLTVLFLFSCTQKENSELIKPDPANIKVVGQSEAEMTSPPLVPKPVGNREATKLIVNMEIVEKEGQMADGVTYIYWKYGGTVTGGFIRTRICDEV